MREQITPLEAAQLLGVTREAVYQMIRRGQLDGYCVGRKKIIYKDSVETYKEKHRFPVQKETPPNVQRGIKDIKVPIRTPKAASVPLGFVHLRL